MARIRQEIQIQGKACWTLFDTGARNSFVVPEIAARLTTSKADQPIKAAIGGEVKVVQETAISEGWLEATGFPPTPEWWTG